jgi:hypothetical protein
MVDSWRTLFVFGSADGQFCMEIDIRAEKVTSRVSFSACAVRSISLLVANNGPTFSFGY